jgi:dUTP pyrophosphatase
MKNEPRINPEGPRVALYILPGCVAPVRKTDGAIGYDASIRALVSPLEMDPHKPYLRKTLFDFRHKPLDERMAGRVRMERNKGGSSELVYQLLPGEYVTAGLGFIVAMPFPLFYWMAPRSGLASKWGITITNAPGTVDPDYRGEAGAIVRNTSNEIFLLKHNMRIIQRIFQYAIIPEFAGVKRYRDLPPTVRGAGGFGSTGIR